MSEHTPGPWVIDEFYEPGGFYKIRAADSTICHAHSLAENGSDAETDANACLIAAAPELADALERYVSEFWAASAFSEREKQAFREDYSGHCLVQAEVALRKAGRL